MAEPYYIDTAWNVNNNESSAWGGVVIQKKVAEVNLEYDKPAVQEAVLRMKNALTTHKRMGCKAVILIHGYGSTGVGGSIKSAVKKCLAEPGMKGIVRASAGGEQWGEMRRDMLAMCRALERFEDRIRNNDGVTVVILR